jgi:poly-gamma-glutamate biosynthesis protein PgsC/CapC
MTELLPLSVGLGLAVSLLMTDLFGIATGGLIVPGYVALNLGAPRHLVATLVAALLTFGVMRALGHIMILYGRRRAALSILVGYLMGAILAAATRHAAWAVGPLLGPGGALALSGFEVIGYVIPGLLALCLERQGILETLCALWTAAVLVRLGLILVAGSQLAP